MSKFSNDGHKSQLTQKQIDKRVAELRINYLNKVRKLTRKQNPVNRFISWLRSFKDK